MGEEEEEMFRVFAGGECFKKCVKLCSSFNGRVFEGGKTLVTRRKRLKKLCWW